MLTVCGVRPPRAAEWLHVWSASSKELYSFDGSELEYVSQDQLTLSLISSRAVKPPALSSCHEITLVRRPIISSMSTSLAQVTCPGYFN